MYDFTITNGGHPPVIITNVRGELSDLRTALRQAMDEYNEVQVVCENTGKAANFDIGTGHLPAHYELADLL